MKVLLIGDYPPPHGGVAVHVEQLHNFFQSRGIESQVLDIGKGGRLVPSVLPVRSPAKLLAQLARYAARGFTFHLHTSGNNPKAWALVAAVAQLPAPKVVTLHSGLVPKFLAASSWRQRFANLALRRFDRVIAVSEAVRDAVVLCGTSPAKVEVYPAFCASQVVPGAAPAGFDAVRARRSPLLAVQHHPSPVYGRDLMFAALSGLSRRYPDVGLAVFGSGTHDAAFAQAARAHKVERLIENFGELDHSAALAVIRWSDAFIRPTTADGDSISVREALTLGVPCVASDVCARPQGTATFHAGDADDLVEQVTQVLVRGVHPVQSPDAGPKVLELYEQIRTRSPAELQPARV